MNTYHMTLSMQYIVLVNRINGKLLEISGWWGEKYLENVKTLKTLWRSNEIPDNPTRINRIDNDAIKSVNQLYGPNSTCWVVKLKNGEEYATWR